MTADGTYRPSTRVTTAAELDALPVGSVLVHPLDPAWTLTRGSYTDGRPWGGGDGKRYASVTVAAHDFTVLFRPDAPQPATTDEVVGRALSTLYNAEPGSREKDAAYETVSAALAARGDAAPGEVEWGVEIAPGAIGATPDEATARSMVTGSSAKVVQRTVSAWREVRP